MVLFSRRDTKKVREWNKEEKEKFLKQEYWEQLGKNEWLDKEGERGGEKVEERGRRGSWEGELVHKKWKKLWLKRVERKGLQV